MASLLSLLLNKFAMSLYWSPVLHEPSSKWAPLDMDHHCHCGLQLLKNC